MLQEFSTLSVSMTMCRLPLISNACKKDKFHSS